jgi:hypothetical protein
MTEKINRNEIVSDHLCELLHAIAEDAGPNYLRAIEYAEDLVGLLRALHACQTYHDGWQCEGRLGPIETARFLRENLDGYDWWDAAAPAEEKEDEWA